MSQPFDLDAAVTEAAGEPFAFTWGGQSFKLPSVLELDIEIQLQLIDLIERLDNTNPDPKSLLSVFDLIVGKDVLAQMRAVRPVGGAALMVLVDKWLSGQGGALGKLPASPASSASTAPPSKQTSRSGRARKTS
jgi:hypothetical protein